MTRQGAHGAAAVAEGGAVDPALIVVSGPEQQQLDAHLPDGGLPPLPGVHNACVFRATKAAPEMADGRGWTYHHHVDIACWKGRLYVGWNSCERDEDVWPSRELYATSEDGLTWSGPSELFPQGVSTPLRMYFFHAPNGRMLAIAGLRVDQANTSEDAKGGLVVREVREDHTLGEVYTLQPAARAGPRPALFRDSPDAGFATACEQLLADTVYLEQQDLGRLLGERRMVWHDAGAWPAGTVPGDDAKWVCGKAFSFYRRADRAIVGVCKMGYVTTSGDEGATWTRPVVPATLVTGKAKVFGQRTSDGRYALVYNPSKRNRFPLAIATGADGVHFSDLRIVHGELPVQRYEGMMRSIGPQYVRGVSAWSDDGSRAGEGAAWFVYSVSKEDIWVSRVPVPAVADARGPAADRFAEMGQGPHVPGWNVYRPKWASVGVVHDAASDVGWLQLENSDPFDYARATRVFSEAVRVTVSFRVRAMQDTGGRLDVELLPRLGGARPVRLTFAVDGMLRATGRAGGEFQLAKYSAGKWLAVEVSASATAQTFSVRVEGRELLSNVPVAETVSGPFNRISFRTGAYRGIGGAQPVPVDSDRPMAVANGWRVADVRVG